MVGRVADEVVLSNDERTILEAQLPPLVEAYFREDLLEERRVLMQDWADFVTGGEVPARLSEKL